MRGLGSSAFIYKIHWKKDRPLWPGSSAFSQNVIKIGSSAFVRSSALTHKIVCFGSKDRLLSAGSSAFDWTDYIRRSERSTRAKNWHETLGTRFYWPESFRWGLPTAYWQIGQEWPVSLKVAHNVSDHCESKVPKNNHIRSQDVPESQQLPVCHVI